MDGSPLLCTTCRVVLVAQADYDNHCRSEGHLRRQAEGPAVAPHLPPGFVHSICPAIVPAPIWAGHAAGKKHQAKLRFERYQAAAEQAKGPQHGVELLPKDGLDFGLVEFKAFTSATEHSKVAKLVIIKTGSLACRVTKVEFASPQVGSRQRFTASDKKLKIKSNSERTLQVHFHPRNEAGSFSDDLLLSVQTTPVQGAPVHFVLRCPLRGKVGCGKHIQDFSAKQPYVDKKDRQRRPRAHDVVPAPGLGGASLYIRPLDSLRISDALRALVKDEERPLALRLAHFQRAFLPQEFSPTTFARHWSTLLKVERVQEELDAHSYDLDSVLLSRSGTSKLFFLAVPGLAEKRPSVMRGDVVNVRVAGTSEKWYQGRVVEVRLNDIGLRFARFNPSPSARFDVQFVPPPTTTRRELTALSHATAPAALLFPSQTPSDYPPRRAMHEQAAQPDFFDRALESNPEQRDAVISIVHATSGAAPFVLFGPPGTGKTTTLAEGIKQLFAFGSSKILVTAPSNAAADLFCTKLGFAPPDLFRLNAPSRFVASVPDGVRRYSLVGHDEHGECFVIPTKADFEKYRVVVATCLSAFMLFDRGLGDGWFSHIIIDEAGQATEPEAFVPLSLAGPQTRVVLAGDPKQLGPIIRSPFAERGGLDVSLLERLMAMPIYSDSSMRGISHVKLVRNFRSHAAILSIPNELWYESELRACASRSVTNRVSTWSGWPEGAAHDFPVLFHAVRGEDEREGTNPSFFNVAEVTLVAAYVDALLHQREGLDLEEKDIGIISPYRSQVQKIRKAVNRPSLNVGSVEQLQGQERPVIIISTVRSNDSYLAHDARFSLGFIAHPKRLNVALTRAQAALIVVGNPEVLALDANWRKFLCFCHDHGAWAGEKWDADSAKREGFDPVGIARDRMDELTKTLAGMGLGEDDGEGSWTSGGNSSNED